MRYGLREIANVMLKTKAPEQRVGGKMIEKAGTPICHFTSLKTSSIEGAATTVYAQGGRGNPRLIAWEGERTLTLTMEDALISPMGIALLTGADLIDNEAKDMVAHITENVDKGTGGKFTLTETPLFTNGLTAWYCELDSEGNPTGSFKEFTNVDSITVDENVTAILVDYYYTEQGVTATQIDIEPGKFGGNYYLEAETLMRDEATGKDDAAEFILPNCKIQSNFTFSMGASGDPSTFTFTVDAFPGVIKGGSASKKVLCAIQIIPDTTAGE